MWIGIVQIMSSRAEDGACCKAMKMPSGKSAMSLTGSGRHFPRRSGCGRSGPAVRSAAIVSASRDASAAEKPASSAASQRRSNCPGNARAHIRRGVGGQIGGDLRGSASLLRSDGCLTPLIHRLMYDGS